MANRTKTSMNTTARVSHKSSAQLDREIEAVVKNNKTELAIKSLRRFAVSHGETQFADMCTAALKGQQWARDRLGLDWGSGLSDTNWGGSSLLAIRTTNTNRPSNRAR